MKRFGPFKIFEVIGMNAVYIHLLENINIHPVVYVEQNAQVRKQLSDICNPQPAQGHPFLDETGELVIEVENILGRRKIGKAFNYALYIEKHRTMN